MSDGSVSDHGDAVGIQNRDATSFIACGKCGNVTLRIGCASCQVGSLSEAERLVASEGYNCITPVESSGNLDGSYATLSPLAAAEKRVLEELAAARTAAAGMDDDATRGDAVALATDAALAAWIARAQREESRREAEEPFLDLFGATSACLPTRRLRSSPS